MAFLAFLLFFIGMAGYTLHPYVTIAAFVGAAIAWRKK